jgi:chromosome partitioning protein
MTEDSFSHNNRTQVPGIACLDDRAAPAPADLTLGTAPASAPRPAALAGSSTDIVPARVEIETAGEALAAESVAVIVSAHSQATDSDAATIAQTSAVEPLPESWLAPPATSGSSAADDGTALAGPGPPGGDADRAPQDSAPAADMVWPEPPPAAVPPSHAAEPPPAAFFAVPPPVEPPSASSLAPTLVAPAASPPRAARVLVLANQKGGVGKTTTAINLGTALAAIGEHVLILDLDPQGNASTGLGISQRDRERTTYDVLTGELSVRAAIRETAVPRLSIVPSTVDLSGFEMEVAQARDRAFRLRNALAHLNTGADAESAYSYVLIDCPPSLNVVTVNAMAAADAVLVPLQCEFFALEGLSQLLKTVEQVRVTLNPRLSIHGIVLTMYDARNNLSGQVVADVRSFMGDKVYQTIIPRNVRVSEAPSHGKPVLLYDLKCVGSQAYLRLASEIIQREKALRAA